uniref:Methylmalonyl-CoA epimerase, mitochondrial n=1 Tax=Cyprinus carpio TaxID=7962 RepID=A0A8C1X1P6_CYPCA
MASSLLKVAVSLSFSFKGLQHLELLYSNCTRCSCMHLTPVKLGRINHVAIRARVSATVPLPEHGVYTVFVELGNTKLELLHPLGEKSPIAGFLQKNKAGGMHHICIEVDDINAAIVYLKEKKIRLLSPEPPIGAHGKPVMFLHPKDCGGVLVEIEQA